MSESRSTPGLNPFFMLSRAHRAGLHEDINSFGTRVLKVHEPQTIEMHNYLSSNGCPVFTAEKSKNETNFLELIIPEGARDVNTLLSQPMDEVQYRDVLITLGQALRKVYDSTGQIPVGSVTDTLAVAFDTETAAVDVFLVPPYVLAAPEPSTVTPELFTDNPEWKDPIWEGWSHVQAGS